MPARFDGEGRWHDRFNRQGRRDALPLLTITKACEVCGAPYETPPCQADRRRFCSMPCAYKGRRARAAVGTSFNKRDGRWYIHCRGGGTYRYARAVMEAHLGRELRPGEVVHHINRDRSDDRIGNLQLLPSQAEHIQLHHREDGSPDRAGEKNGRAKLTREQVAAIKSDPRRICDIARDYGICWSQAANIVKGRHWTDIEGRAA